MKSLALALLLAVPALADDVPLAVEVRTGLIETVGGGRLEVAGGAYLPHARLMANAQELAKLRAENISLRESVSVAPTAVWVLGGTALGVGLGLVLHFLVLPAR